MIHAISLFCLLCSAPPPASQPVTVEKKDPAGQLLARYQADAEGRRCGKYEEFFDDGKLKLRAMYRMDKRSGECVEFYPTGRTLRTSSYRDDVLSGPVIEYEPAGQVRLNAAYQAGKLHGPYKEFQAGKLVKDQRWQEGELVYGKSTAQIEAVFGEIRRMSVEVLAAAAEDGEGMRKAGPPTDFQARWLRTLLEFRYLCDVAWDVSLDESYNRHCQLTASLCRKLGKITHGPERNPGMKEEDFRMGCRGAGSSNLAQGGSDIIRMFMGDGGVPNLGHRRWCVNPRMGRTGFGSDNGFAAMWSMDGSGKGGFPSYNFVAFPPPGYVPTSHFDASWRWHVTVDPGRFTLSDELAVTVAPCQLRNGEIKLGKPVKTPHTVDRGGFGVANAIIFLPAGVSLDGRSFYRVSLSGLKDPEGQPALLSYYVLFYRR